MQWFESNPHGANPGFRGKMNWRAHQAGRSLFPSSFARGGFAATAFAPTAGEAFVSPWRRTHQSGSPQHITNLRRMQAANPSNKRIAKALQRAESGPAKTGFFGGITGLGVRGAFAALPAFTTEGGVYEKGMAVAGGAAAVVGWDVGMKVGMGVGAAVGSVVPFAGTAIGAGVGALVGAFAGSMLAEEGFRAAAEIPTRMVEETRKRRGLNWVGDTSAFNTQKAYTMRQQSLQAMNRGMMNSRSVLGREAMMIHQ
jgi:hypothetical protein